MQTILQFGFGEVITSTWYGGYASFKGKFCKKQDSTYLNFIKNKIILGTWDDHDFGVNDGGQEYLFKKRKSKLLIWFFRHSYNALKGTETAFIIPKQ
jgi:hypothetical protein